MRREDRGEGKIQVEERREKNESKKKRRKTNRVKYDVEEEGWGYEVATWKR